MRAAYWKKRKRERQSVLWYNDHTVVASDHYWSWILVCISLWCVMMAFWISEYVLLGLLGFSLNLISVIAFLRIREMQTPNNFFIFNLAVADLSLNINGLVAAYASYLRWEYPKHDLWNCVKTWWKQKKCFIAHKDVSAEIARHSFNMKLRNICMYKYSNTCVFVFFWPLEDIGRSGRRAVRFMRFREWCRSSPPSVFSLPLLGTDIISTVLVSINGNICHT